MTRWGEGGKVAEWRLKQNGSAISGCYHHYHCHNHANDHCCNKHQEHIDHRALLLGNFNYLTILHSKDYCVEIVASFDQDLETISH